MAARQDFPAGRWRARWIWADPATAAGGAPAHRHAVALRRSFDLAAVPERVPARLVAISRYALWVNGAEVARGPVRANPRRQPWDDLDLAAHLRPGANTLAAVAWCYGGPAPWWLPPPELANDLTRGAFVLEARLGDGDWLVTDGDGAWQGTVLDGWTAEAASGVSGRGRERVDGRSLPAGWDLAGAELPWPAAMARNAMTTGEAGRPEPPSFPLGPLEPRPISWPAADDVVLAPGPGGAHLADRVVVGAVEVDVEGPPGAVVDVRTAEFLDAHGRPKPGDHDSGVAFTCDGGRRILRSCDLYGLRGALVEAPDGTQVHRVTVRERLHPVTGGGSFACSDPRLDQIWQVGRRTVSICSLDAYVDCPTREQRAWTGDAVVHQMVDLATNADWSLARWYPRLAATPRPDGMLPMAVACDLEQVDVTVIPDWALHWVHAVWNLYRYVGDRDEIAGLLGAVEGVLRWFEPFCDRDGLLTDVFGWVIVDWAAVETDGVSAALCGLWGRGLAELAEMATWLGDAGRAGWARRAHRRLRAGFERLWDPERGRYADTLVRGERLPAASQHGQAAAIVGGLAPADRRARLVEVLTDEDALVHAAFSSPEGPVTPGGDTPPGGDYLRTGHPAPWWDVDRQVVRAQPFFRYVVHDALAAAGRADLVAGACLDWTAALERCPTSWTETWYGGTVSHGWSSTPTRDLTTRVLGVEPAEPGFVAVRVEPALGPLAWARGTVPSPAGPIHVDAAPDGVDVESPLPVVWHGRSYPPGRHRLVPPAD